MRDFGSTRPGGRVPEWAVYGAAATEAMLDAIARSDGYARVGRPRRWRASTCPTRPIGRLRFPQRRTGDQPGRDRAREHGGEPDDGVSTAGGTILDIVDPPPRLVGAGR